jgi:hypothetical protein
MALRCPLLFTMNSFTLRKRRAHLGKTLGLSRNDLNRLVSRTPECLFRDSENMGHRVKKNAAALGLSPESVIRLMIRTPSALSGPLATLRRKIAIYAKVFGIDAERFIQAAVKQPTVLSRNPETLVRDIKSTAARLNLDLKSFVEMALRQPALFTLKPATIARKFQIIKKLAALNGRVQSAHSIIEQLPAALCYSAEHLQRCGKFLEMRPGRPNVARLLTFSATRLKQHFANLPAGS